MKSVCIKSNNNYVIDYLLKDLSSINLDNTYLSNHSFKIYNNVIIHYFGNSIDEFYNILCDKITSCIMFFYEKKLIKNIINYNYFYFNDLEKQKIIDDSIDLLSTDEDVYTQKYNCIFESLKNYLLEHHSLVLNGFVNFRLKDYKEILDYNVDICVSNFLIEREYYEFINILQLYVNSKETTIDTVHLLYVNQESILLDKKKNVIEIKESLSAPTYLSDISFSSNDYCLNALLNLLPQNLHIHLVDYYEDEFITTLKLIFENRITICNDCDICRVYRLTNNVALKD